MSNDRFLARAQEVLRQAEKKAEHELDAMMAEHAAAGRLQSGATAKRAVEIFFIALSAASNQILDEIARQIEARGKEWERALRSVRQAVEQSVARFQPTLDRCFQKCGVAGSPAALSAIGKTQEERKAELLRSVDAFTEGWTSPQPKPWHERNPKTYAATLVVLGAVAGQAVEALAAAI